MILSEMEAREALRLALARSARVRAHLVESRARLQSDMPLSAAKVASLSTEETERLDAMLKRFETALEVLQRQVFRLIAICTHEPASEMSIKELTERMAAFGIVDDLTRWFDVISLRNEIVHGYPDDAALRAAALSKVHGQIGYLSDTFDRATEFAKAHGLIDGAKP